jgi:hypothetical protein
MTDKSICPHATSCELYGKFSLKSVLKIWQVRYCETEDRYQTCERYKLSRAGQSVPPNLLPNGERLVIR